MTAIQKLRSSGALRFSTEIAPRPRTEGWHFAELQGRLVELVGEHSSASLSMTARLLHEAQEKGEPCAWVSGQSTLLYPPDLAANGIDLDALVFVSLASLQGALRAADQLLRCGAFGLVVFDLKTERSVPFSMQMRLAGLCKEHRCALLCLSGTSRFPLAGLRLRSESAWQERGLVGRLQVEKNKGSGGSVRWQYEQSFHGPMGMC